VLGEPRYLAAAKLQLINKIPKCEREASLSSNSTCSMLKYLSPHLLMCHAAISVKGAHMWERNCRSAKAKASDASEEASRCDGKWV
jgi:hypothetical protein